MTERFNVPLCIFQPKLLKKIIAVYIDGSYFPLCC